MTPSKSSELTSGSSRRNQFEIWAEVLEVCVRTGRTQSWLLRQLRLKTSAIKEALEFLLGAGLIAATINADVDTRQYQTTPKGEEALTTYYKLITKYFVKD
ncbi:MAG: hypothetical protein RBG13Loki_0200 [Promethearchaeota archaeon CR_4]|nr:MAG: hypothetical protein RBG13Loki_0200 [Candidatus Lokiarchaeota archaeon CR_4]